MFAAVLLLVGVAKPAAAQTPTPVVGCCHCQNCETDPEPLCLDWIGSSACTAYCTQPSFGCLSVGYSTSQSCATGCAGNPAITGTPTHTPTITPTRTPTPTRTNTPLATSTPFVCCQCPQPACSSTGANCAAPCTPFVGQVCFAESGRCTTPTPTFTITPTTTSPPSFTPRTPTSTPTPTPTFYADYYKCYVADGPNKEFDITLTDKLEGEKKHRVLTRETTFCTPAKKDGSRVAAPDNYLTCYELHDATGEENFGNSVQTIQNELSSNPNMQASVVDARRPDRICVPTRLR